jgi:hypothetical protein
MSTSGWRSRWAPATGTRAGDDVDDAGGCPASVNASANITEVSGVISAGLRTIVLPAAIAGRIFQAAICSG